ncbi:MAG: hypothetical protein EAX95_13035 [Candidatus Thorarchaeota archaeon]|nr:hypothetical protein [Candidatus Thorarchaeota archaeon]
MRVDICLTKLKYELPEHIVTQIVKEVKSEMGTETRAAAHQCRVAKAKGECEIDSRGDCIL